MSVEKQPLDKASSLDEFSFYQKVMQNPEQLDEAVQAYLAAHPEKKQVVQQARKMDQLMKSTLTAIQPPEQLADKILLQTAKSENTIIGCLKTLCGLCFERLQKSWRALQALDEKWRWMGGAAIASSVLMMAMMPQIQSYIQTQHQQIAQAEALNQIETALVQHVNKHARLAKKTTPIPEDELKSKLAEIGASLAEPMDFVTHVSECNINGIKGLHLVIQSFSGPVTVIILPKVTVPQMVAFKKQIYQGELLPVQGATVAVLGQNMTQVGWAQMAVLNHIQFGERQKKQS